MEKSMTKEDALKIYLEKTARFNIFKVLGMQKGSENRHSNIIAWLLNPNESHNLKTQFLYKFLKSLSINADQYNLDDVSITREDSNEFGRPDIIIENDEFMCLVEVKFGTKETNSQSDTIVFLGDYIDVGHNPKAVIERLIELQKETNCIFLMGNHEDILLKVLKTKNQDDVEYWLSVGGVTTFDSYGDFFLPKSHVQFLKNLKLYYQTEKYFFVHAGIRPDKPLEEQEKEDFLWIRDNFIYKKHSLNQKVIFGHTPFYAPYIDDDKIGINTNSGRGENEKLTALICDENIFVTSDTL